MHELLEGKSFRVVHRNDVVPHWPNELVVHDYHHIAREVWYSNDGSPLEYVVCDESGEDGSCSISEPGIRF